MKKSLLWTIVLVLSVSIIGAFSVTGCKEEAVEEAAVTEEEAAVTEEEAAVTEEEVAEEYEPVTIEYWNVNTESFGGPQVEQFIEDFNATNDKNITVKQASYGGNYSQLNMALQASLAAGIYPGVVQVSYAALNYIAENFPQHTDLEKIITKYAPEDASFLDEKYNPLVLELARSINNRLLGLPYGFSTPLLYCNNDIFRDAGLDPEDPPVTWQDVYDYSTKIKEATGKYGIFIQSAGDTYAIIPIFLSNGIDKMFEPDGKGGYRTTFNNEKAIEAWTFIQNLTLEGLNANLVHEEGTAGFFAGEIGMHITTSGRASYIANEVDFDARATWFPKFDDNPLAVCIGGNMLTIFAQTDREVLSCWEFEKYLLDSKQINTWVRGTGYLPPTKDALEDPELKNYVDETPMLKTAIEQRDEAARPWTSWPGAYGLQIDQLLIDMRDAILSGEDVATVIGRTATAIDELLKGTEE